MPKQTRTEVITFKVDDSLKDALEGINNRSAFIRAAIMSALDSTCPLCKGTGILTPHQQKHWNEFRKSHSIEKCAECQAYFLSCKKGKE
ncbi:MAG: CopG family transcriptional regulator [Lentisphaerae bacterium]|nr:CopG family transcriptional regulator [Lentisphaerota bacterium]MCP4101772.1 CopG family transcriptional regulator [Lentisphaerota bacterium]